MTDANLTSALSEAVLIQNEALGAYAIWKFGLGFQDIEGRAATLPLSFLILPLVLHAPTLAIVLSTQKASGLHLFAGKLGEKRENLIAIHNRAIALRQCTLESLMRAEQSSLIRIDPAEATLWAVGLNDDKSVPLLPERIRRIGMACERIGYWFASVSDQQIVRTLKVEF
ncbi:DUF6521 family protein [Acinetobacter bereziniae]|uniref:DUF6521 family protein n=1 Tax=Acinetobacter bereziniae TaxID=106648 RepID=A0A8I1AJ16_ACIBZ|nr:MULTISPECIES: three component ABC system middle component [Acinetobacter]MDG3554505.1 DUF6521 family protein [Acinetobacter bereziniae]MDH1375673.1 DUF6521 family protein [Acinetobacter junii]MDP6001100.1 DUF6521 family protein [Acinetobacter bereziniae]QQC79219.1 hypothetical protein I9192_14700 [Acinetobacter bereziniae]QQC83587.1 hypothetical protein I9190_15005 [Acinetobacter bereziniae]